MVLYFHFHHLQDALRLQENTLFVEREEQAKCLEDFDEEQRATEFREETHLCLICYGYDGSLLLRTGIGKRLVPRLRDSRVLASSGCGGGVFHAI